MIPDYLEQKFTHAQLQAIRKFIIVPNWGKIADDREGKKFLNVSETDTRYGTTYTHKYLFVDAPGNDYHSLQAYIAANFADISKRTHASYEAGYTQPFTIRDGWMGDSTLKLLAKESITRLGNDKFHELYQKGNIDEKIAKAKKTYQDAKEKRLEKRAAKFTSPGQKEIVRRATMLLINDTLQKAGLPFKLSADIRGMRDKVFFHINTTDQISKDSQFHKLFRSRDYYAAKEETNDFDETGEALYQSFVESGFDMDTLLRIMATDNTSEHVRQFGVVFGEQLALGAIDRNPLVRKAAKLKMTKKKELAAEAAHAQPFQKALKQLEESLNDSEEAQ